MATANESGTAVGAEDAEQIKTEWLNRVENLVAEVQAWCESLDWVARRIDVKLRDSRIGKYDAPGLVFQKETCRLVLEPIGRSSPGTQGVVDLYLMPGLDDVATLLYHDRAWHIHRASTDSDGAESSLTNSAEPLTRELFRAVIEEMMGHVSEA